MLININMRYSELTESNDDMFAKGMISGKLIHKLSGIHPQFKAINVKDSGEHFVSYYYMFTIPNDKGFTIRCGGDFEYNYFGSHSCTLGHMTVYVEGESHAEAWKQQIEDSLVYRAGSIEGSGVSGPDGIGTLKNFFDDLYDMMTDSLREINFL